MRSKANWAEEPLSLIVQTPSLRTFYIPMYQPNISYITNKIHHGWWNNDMYVVWSQVDCLCIQYMYNKEQWRSGA